MHISSSSRIPDHCRPYALSHASDPDYLQSCKHKHDLICDRCNLFPAAVHEMESVLDEGDIPLDEKEEMKFIVTQAKKNIEAWKAHLLRSINQDQARLDILDKLDDTSVLVILDWAMKFIPRRYRESQADWFGKRGISWHISVAMRKIAGKLQNVTLVHVFDKSNQDSLYVIAVIDDVICQLKRAMPELKSVNFRQDNAGCYHSSATIIGVQNLARKRKVAIRIDFSDPQGGKGPCDRKAAVLKNHMRTYLNSGNDITNTVEMKTAMESNGGVRGLSVVLGGSLQIPEKYLPEKWEGVSLINDIVYKKRNMEVWRAYDVGNGKKIQYTKFESTKSSSSVTLPTLNKMEDSDQIPDFCDVLARKSRKEKETKADAESHQDDSDTDDDSLFTCSEEGCVKAFQRFSSLQKHLDFGKHQYALEKETFLDRAMQIYAENLESGKANIEEVQESASQPSSDIPPLLMGWALKYSSSSRRFTEAQKKYLTDLFVLGEQTGRKADPEQVSKAMRKTRDANGSFLFDAGSYLTSKQITSFFSRLSAKKSLPATWSSTSDNDEEESNDDMLASQEEIEFERVRQELLSEFVIAHPIVFDTYNICQMVAVSGLSKLSISVLQDICKYFELDCSDITKKRKQPYANILTEFVKNSCTCTN